MKELSEDTRNVVNTLKAYSKNGLKKENDFGELLEFCVSTGNIAVMQHLMLHGNALTKLTRKLSDQNLPEDALLLVQKEFKDQLEKFKYIISEISDSNWDEDFSQRAQQIYLEESKGSVLNLIDLAGDFALFKIMQNEHRESHKDS